MYTRCRLKLSTIHPYVSNLLRNNAAYLQPLDHERWRLLQTLQPPSSCCLLIYLPKRRHSGQTKRHSPRVYRGSSAPTPSALTAVVVVRIGLRVRISISRVGQLAHCHRCVTFPLFFPYLLYLRGVAVWHHVVQVLHLDQRRP